MARSCRAGLIETDALDRDGVTAYLNELAESNPDLMDHMSDGGGLLEGLQMRSLLTAGRDGLRPGRRAPRAADCGPSASTPSRPTPSSALRDSPRSFVEVEERRAPRPTRDAAAAPRSIEELMTNLVTADRRISVQRVGAGRYIAYLPGARAHEGGRLRLVGADPTTYVRQVVRAIEQAVETEDDGRA